MRELVENGHVYIATPPLYLVRKGAEKGDMLGMIKIRDEVAVKDYGDGFKVFKDIKVLER